MTDMALAGIPLADGYGIACRAWAAGIRRPPRLTVTEWADAHRRLPTKGASEPGRWRTSRTPYLQEIQDCLSDSHPARRVVFIKSVQVGATEAGNNWVGWLIATQKAPMMVVQPTIDVAERWSKQRLAPMIEDVPALREKIAPARSRDSGNTTLLKEFPGGVLIVSGANSASSLRSMPIRFLFLDEIDAYPRDLDEEGDPVSLAEARTTTFPRRKVFLVSTPTIESLSRINKEWLASDMRRYQVACPHCGEPQSLEWSGLQWPDGEPEKAAYACKGCGALIDESEKTALLAAGRWVAEHPERDAAGFHINALYTPIGLGLSWAELAREWIAAQRDPIRLKTFINLRLGECFADPNEKLDWDEIKSRAGGQEARTIPRGCLMLTAGVDVQKDRFAFLLLGHGRGGVQWVIDYVELPADPTRPEEWEKIDAYLAEPRQSSCGVPMRISMAAIDSGYLSDDVMNYTRTRRNRGVIAVKGSSMPNRPIITKGSKVDFNWRGSTIRNGAELWSVGSDTAKHQLFARLTADRKHPEHDRMIRFPVGLDESFYSQLTAEVFDSTKRKWVKVRPRNEALDTYCYAVAAGMHPNVRVHTWKEPHWARLEAALEPVAGDLFSPPATPTAVKPVQDNVLEAESDGMFADILSARLSRFNAASGARQRNENRGRE